MHVKTGQARTGAIATGVLAALVALPSIGADLFVAGPVESLNAATHEAIVLGQRIQLDARQFVRVQAAVRRDSAIGYQPYLEVGGTDTRDGVILAKTVQRGNVPYVAGATSARAPARQDHSRRSADAKRLDGQ